MSKDVNYQVCLMLLSQPKHMNKLPREGTSRTQGSKVLSLSLSLHYIFSGKLWIFLFPSVYSSFLSHCCCLLVNLKFKLIAERLSLNMWFVQTLAQLHRCNANCGIKYSYKSFTVWLHEIRTIREQAQAEHLGKMKHRDFYYNCCFITERVLT